MKPDPDGDHGGAAASPLWMVTREPALNELVEYLDERRAPIVADPAGQHRLRFSLGAVERARSSFSRMIRGGEGHLHGLCELLGQQLYAEGQYRLRSVVVGESPGSRGRFTLMQPLLRDDLYSQTDLDLGTRLLGRFRVQEGEAWERARLVANFVEYEPLAPNRHGLHKVVSRIKAEEEIWNKVVDEIFHLDGLLERDKQLRHLSRFVKDIFGVKMVVGSVEEALLLQGELESQSWIESSDPVQSDRPSEFGFLEVKDYLSGGGQKASGWRAIKSVARWKDQLFEFQIQPLRNYHNELERFTSESHDEFKLQRETLRNRIAQQIPLFGFYRDLLRWLFQDPSSEPPRFGGIEIELVE